MDTNCVGFNTIFLAPIDFCRNVLMHPTAICVIGSPICGCDCFGQGAKYRIWKQLCIKSCCRIGGIWTQIALKHCQLQIANLLSFSQIAFQGKGFQYYFFFLISQLIRIMEIFCRIVAYLSCWIMVIVPTNS